MIIKFENKYEMKIVKLINVYINLVETNVRNSSENIYVSMGGYYRELAFDYFDEKIMHVIWNFITRDIRNNIGESIKRRLIK